jgi:hypothetical protein
MEPSAAHHDRQPLQRVDQQQQWFDHPAEQHPAPNAFSRSLPQSQQVPAGPSVTAGSRRQETADPSTTAAATTTTSSEQHSQGPPALPVSLSLARSGSSSSMLLATPPPVRRHSKPRRQQDELHHSTDDLTALHKQQKRSSSDSSMKSVEQQQQQGGSNQLPLLPTTPGLAALPGTPAAAAAAPLTPSPVPLVFSEGHWPPLAPLPAAPQSTSGQRLVLGSMAQRRAALMMTGQPSAHRQLEPSPGGVARTATDTSAGRRPLYLLDTWIAQQQQQQQQQQHPPNNPLQDPQLPASSSAGVPAGQLGAVDEPLGLMQPPTREQLQQQDMTAPSGQEGPGGGHLGPPPPAAAAAAADQATAGDGVRQAAPAVGDPGGLMTSSSSGGGGAAGIASQDVLVAAAAGPLQVSADPAGQLTPPRAAAAVTAGQLWPGAPMVSRPGQLMPVGKPAGSAAAAAATAAAGKENRVEQDAAAVCAASPLVQAKCSRAINSTTARCSGSCSPPGAATAPWQAAAAAAALMKAGVTRTMHYVRHPRLPGSSRLTLNTRRVRHCVGFPGGGTGGIDGGRRAKPLVIISCCLAGT